MKYCCNCEKQGTMRCPSSSKCYETSNKPYYKAKYSKPGFLKGLVCKFIVWFVIKKCDNYFRYKNYDCWVFKLKGKDTRE